MAKGSGHIRRTVVREENVDFYALSKESAKDAVNGASLQAGVFNISNGISGKLEITKSDIRNITGKNFVDNKFNVLKNSIAKNIRQFIEEAQYEGWRETDEGRHLEAAFFVYYSKKYDIKAYLCLRKMKESGNFKPYEIVPEYLFDKSKLKKGLPPM